LFEEPGDGRGAEQALEQVLHGLWVETLGFAGIGIHRRILGLAHNADFELIADRDLRARCEARALRFGRRLILERSSIPSIEQANALADALDRD
jgi:5-methylthioribose kinase